MANWFYILVMIGGGVLLAFQSPINAGLGRNIGTYEAALISFLVGSLGTLVAALLFGKGNLRAVTSVPAWQLVGGLLGAIYIILIIVAVPRLGVTTLMVSVLLGQLASAMVIDHFGWFGMTVRPITWNRIAALPLLAAALALMNLPTGRR
jgi:transporter family-2 protein